jgi:hypothetical protein
MQHFGQHLFMAAGTPQNSPYGGKIIVDISGCFDNRDRLCVKQTVYPVSGQNQETAQYFVRYYQPTSDPQFTPWIDMSRARWAGTGPAVNGWTKLPNGLIIAYGTLRMETGTTLNKWVPPVKLPDSSVFNLTYRSSVPRKISGAWVDGGLNVYLEAPEPQAVNISISAIGF